MIKRTVIGIWFWSISLCALAQNDSVYSYNIDDTVQTQVVEPPQEYSTDDELTTQDEPTTPDYNTATISADTIAAWKRKKEFGYMVYLDSLLRSEDKKKVKDVKPVSAPSLGFLNFLTSPFVIYFLWFLAALLVGYVLWQFFDVKGVFSRRGKKLAVEEIKEEEKGINESDLDGSLRTAEQNGNHRLATRVLFLMVLRKLNERGLIQYEQDKTNGRYASELDANLRPGFRTLAMHYEYQWYGQREVTADQYQQIKKLFTDYLRMIA